MHAVGDGRSPFPEEVFRDTISRELQLPEHAHCPGFTRYSDTFRLKFLGSLVTRDAHDIPQDRKFDRRVPCSLAHPGLCQTQHAGILSKVRPCASALRKCTQDVRLGTFFQLRFDSIDEDGDLVAWFCIAYRHGSPKVLLLSPGVLDEASSQVRLDDGDSGPYEYCMDLTALGRIFLAYEPSAIHFSLAPVDPACALTSAACVGLLPDWQARVENEARQLYPPQPRRRARIAADADPVAKERLAGLREVTRLVQDRGPSPDRPRQARAPRARAIHVPETSSDSEEGGKGKKGRAPKEIDSDVPMMTSETEVEVEVASQMAAPVVRTMESSAASSSAGAVEFARADGEGGAPPIMVAERDVGAPPVAGADSEEAAAPAEPRQQRKIAFGPWSISEIKQKGKIVGWGGNCHRHSNSNDKPGALCKRVFTYSGNTAQETRAIAKKWLLLGAEIAPDDPDARRAHLFGIPRLAIPIEDEAELDAQAAALV